MNYPNLFRDFSWKLGVHKAPFAKSYFEDSILSGKGRYVNVENKYKWLVVTKTRTYSCSTRKEARMVWKYSKLDDTNSI